MHEGDPTWVHEVPPGVALLICQNHLLGYDPEVRDAVVPPLTRGRLPPTRPAAGSILFLFRDYPPNRVLPPRRKPSMKICRVALLMTFGVISVSDAAEPGGLTETDRQALRRYARDTWRSFEAMAWPGGLPADGLPSAPTVGTTPIARRPRRPTSPPTSGPRWPPSDSA